MRTSDTLARPAPQDPHDVLDTGVTPTDPCAFRGCLDQSIEREGRPRLVARWSVDSRSSLALQWQLVDGMVG
jgi:hypothetical protein